MYDHEIKLLLIENNDANAALISRLLKQAPGRKFAVTAFNRLRDALDYLRFHEYDIVLLGPGSPDEKAAAALDAIRAEFKDIPVVIVTALDNEDAGIEAIGHGAQDYLVKGTSDERVLAKSILYAMERKCLEVKERRTRTVGTIEDISRRKNDEETAKRNEWILKQAGRLANLGAWEIEFAQLDDINKNPLFWSDEVYRIFGYVPGSIRVTNELFFQRVHPDDRQKISDAVKKAIAEKSPYTIEHRLIRPDGTEAVVAEYAEVLVDADGRPERMIGAVQDITDRKLAEEALKVSENRLKILNENLENLVVRRTEQVRALSAALTFAEQRERKRFSNILHEALQQKLLGARILFNQHVANHESDDVAADHEDLEEGIALLNKAIQTARTLSLELNPPILKSEGLDASLRWLSSHMGKNYGLAIDLEWNGPIETIKGDVQILITQMARELLHNVARHSGAVKASLRVSCGSGRITVIVEDKGKGFNFENLAKTPKNEERFGFFSVRERLNLLGGNLAIESRIGEGTKCTIVCPYANC
jgi:PAS domain S-box-containing protein